MIRAPHKARMLALGGDAFPTDTESLRAALADGAKLAGASDATISLEGNFPSLDSLRMKLAGVRLDSRRPLAAAAENASGGFFSRTVEVTADPALLATVPIRMQLRAEDCVLAFGIVENGTRVARLERCSTGTFDASAGTADIEAALFALARDAASKHGAEVKSARLTLDAESSHRLAVTAVAVAKAMLFTATLTIRGLIEVDDEFKLRLTNTTCTGDGMIANLAASQLRPRLAEFEKHEFSLAALLPSGIRATGIEITGGDALKIHATIAG
jgi:hypothetical protein